MPTETDEPQVATKKCPACAETIRAEAIKCKHCGERLVGYKPSRAALVFQLISGSLMAIFSAVAVVASIVDGDSYPWLTVFMFLIGFVWAVYSVGQLKRVRK